MWGGGGDLLRVDISELPWSDGSLGWWLAGRMATCIGWAAGGRWRRDPGRNEQCVAAGSGQRVTAESRIL